MFSLLFKVVGEVIAKQTLCMKYAFLILINATIVLMVNMLLEFYIIILILISSKWTLQTWQGINVLVGWNWSS